MSVMVINVYLSYFVTSFLRRLYSIKSIDCKYEYLLFYIDLLITFRFIFPVLFK